MSTPTHRPNAVDRAALLLTMLIALGAAGYGVVGAVIRIAAISTNRDVPVVASFMETPATLPIGPGGADVEVAAREVVLRVSDLPAITLGSLMLAEVATALTIVLAAVLAALIVRNVIRGRAFATANVALVGSLTLLLPLGLGANRLFSTMGANGAAAALADSPPVNTAFALDPMVFLGIAALGTIAAAFQIGNRIQRETEGLV